MFIFPHRSFTHLLLLELCAVAENFRSVWRIMFYHLIFVFIIFMPSFSKGSELVNMRWKFGNHLYFAGACPHPKTTLKNPADPLDFYYCHPNSAGHECPAGATCDNLWLGLFVCCAINDTMKDDPGQHDDFDEAFSDSEPSDRHMKNRKNFAIFLPAQNSQTSQDEGNSTVENGSNSQSSESNIYTRGFTGGSTTGHTSFDTRFTDDATNFQPSTDINPISDSLVGNATGLKDSVGSKDNKSSSASFAHIFILQEGTNQRVNVNTYKFPATVTLIKDSGKSVIVDTGLPTDYNLLELFLSGKLPFVHFVHKLNATVLRNQQVWCRSRHCRCCGHYPWASWPFRSFEPFPISRTVLRWLNVLRYNVFNVGIVQCNGSVFVWPCSHKDSWKSSFQSEIAKISERVTVVKTPGHTAEDLSVLVKNVTQLGTVAVVGEYKNFSSVLHVLHNFREKKYRLQSSFMWTLKASRFYKTGDLFISKDDIENPEVWETQAWNSTIQHQHRKMILCSSDYIVPGHGAMFKVEKHMRKLFECKGRTLWFERANFMSADTIFLVVQRSHVWEINFSTFIIISIIFIHTNQ